jgi:hypothetical protein
MYHKMRNDRAIINHKPIISVNGLGEESPVNFQMKLHNGWGQTVLSQDNKLLTKQDFTELYI